MCINGVPQSLLPMTHTPWTTSSFSHTPQTTSSFFLPVKSSPTDLHQGQSWAYFSFVFQGMFFVRSVLLSYLFGKYLQILGHILVSLILPLGITLVVLRVL